MFKDFTCSLLFVAGVLGFADLCAQENVVENHAAHRIGVLTGYGNQSTLDVTYNYKIVFFQVEYSKTIFTKNNWSVEMISQPQINFTSFDRFEEDEINETSIEVGINSGFVIRKRNQSENVEAYFIISSGPLYVPDTPSRQSSGLNFSSSLNLGVNIRLSEKVFLDIRPGVRHLSNARLRLPNRGINNVTAISGLSFYF